MIQTKKRDINFKDDKCVTMDLNFANFRLKKIFRTIKSSNSIN